MSTVRTIAKNTFFNLIATASDVVINFAIGIALARSLGPDDYGLYAFMMWFLSLAVLAVNFGMGEMAKRFVAESIGRQRNDEPAAIVSMALRYRSIAALVACFIVLVLSGFWARTFTDSSHQFLFVLLGVGLLPYVLNFALISVFAGFQKYEYGAYVIMGTNPLRAIAIVVLMVLGFGVQEVLILNIAVWVVGVLIGLLLLRRLIPAKDLFSPRPLDSAGKRRALKYALTTAGVIGVNFFLWQQAEILFIGLYLDEADVGFYTIASRIPLMAMTLIPSVFGLVLLPAISEQFGKGDMDKLRTIYHTAGRYLMMLALPLSAAGVVLAKPIIMLLYGSDYSDSVLLMQIMFVPFAVMGINHAATSVIYGINKPAFILKVGILLIGLSVGLNLWLIPDHGTTGAAIASSVPRLIVVPLYIGFASRKIGVMWPLKDTVRIVLASAMMGLAMYGLVEYVGGALGFGLAIPAGLIVYPVALLALRAIRGEDLDILKRVQELLPVPLRKS